MPNALTNLRRYETLLALEDAEEHAAVIALIKVWAYEHLNAHPNRFARMQEHIQLFREQILEEDLTAYINDHRHEWRLCRRNADLIEEFVKEFALSGACHLDSPRYELVAAVTHRWNQSEEES